MNYGAALEHVKAGGRARRKEWRANQFVFLNPGSKPADLRGAKRIAAALAGELFDTGDKGTTLRLPNLNLASSGSTETGWQASQVDQLSEDWELI
ncbi:Thoeris anti-defense Tad2 family protein [Shinella zoogloeoides]|uniref:Thoeris anti-defense Tad2 family protein n=1 Tax=Shinella zoogloeoides TaxID=352475 RepID=UPI00273FE801|nr:MW1434 family type I TA system toxin [Shinella zoogloeoides]WLR90985.1 DUF2829 domain-containing protein [Shinella zoogloeoides]